MKSTSKSFSEGLGRYVPQEAIPILWKWLEGKNLTIKISPPRRSKLGDFRVDPSKAKPQISVNGDLNPYSFLVTLTHEIAHFEDYIQRGTLQDPHGFNWKRIYSAKLLELYRAEAFDEDLSDAILRHIQHPKAASSSDSQLNEALSLYDTEQNLRLKDLSEETTFITRNGRVFIKGQLQRTRYRCKELSSGRWFLINGQVEVSIYPNS